MENRGAKMLTPSWAQNLLVQTFIHSENYAKCPTFSDSFTRINGFKIHVYSCEISVKGVVPLEFVIKFSAADKKQVSIPRYVVT